VAEQWTQETKGVLHHVLHDLDVLVGGLDGDCHCNLVTEVSLTALSDAGLLVTPQMRAVFDAAKEWRAGHPGTWYADGLEPLCDLLDALAEESR
jgi:hypothetical protein